MIDFHSHILPHMDDGSHSVEESLCMLTSLKKQGVDTVALTPHFYAKDEPPQRFLSRRKASLEELRGQLTPECPEVLVGAEVLYYSGISHLERLPELTLEGSRLLLLEMPFAKWSDYQVDEVIDIHRNGEVAVMMAHVERYLALQSKSVWERLLTNDVIMQTNAEFFFAPVVRRQAVRMLRQGRVHFLGTDCHNMTTRGPHMDLALNAIEKHLGAGAVKLLEQRSECLLREMSL